MRVGILGSGTMAEVHAGAWRTTGALLMGCASANLEQALHLARQFNIKVYQSYTELLRDVDIIDICLPTHLHHRMALQAAAARRHVVCEGPIALSRQDGLEMIQACDEAGVRLYVATGRRFFPQYRLSRELLLRGHIGRLDVLRLQRVTTVSLRSEDEGYFDEARSGGIVVEQMTHDFDYARWLGGEVVQVQTRPRQGTDGRGQYVQAILRFKEGPMALLEGGWVFTPGVFRSALDIVGTDGVVEWRSDAGSSAPRFALKRTGQAAAVELPVSDWSQDPYALQIQHAYQCIRSGEPFEVTAQDGLEALRVALAARESMLTGRPVVL